MNVIEDGRREKAERVVAMHSIKVLLLDFSPIAVLGRTLKRILESSPYLAVGYEKESIDAWHPAQFEESFARIVSKFVPEIIILIIAQNNIMEFGDLIQEMSRKSISQSILAMFENISSLSTLVLTLKSGYVYFIPSPINTENLFTVIWRTIANAV